MVPRASALRVTVVPEPEECNIANTSSYLVRLLQLANAHAEEEMSAPCCFEACYIPGQGARCSALPEASLRVTLPTPDMRRALLVRKAEQQLFSHGYYCFNKRELFFAFLIGGCKQECYPKVHHNIHSV